MSEIGDLLRDAADYLDSHGDTIPDKLLAALEDYLAPGAELHARTKAARNGNAVHPPYQPPSPVRPTQPLKFKTREPKLGEGDEIRKILRQNRNLSFDRRLELKKQLACERGLTLGQVSSMEAHDSGKLRAQREAKHQAAKASAKKRRPRRLPAKAPAARRTAK